MSEIFWVIFAGSAYIVCVCGFTTFLRELRILARKSFFKEPYPYVFYQVGNTVYKVEKSTMCVISKVKLD